MSHLLANEKDHLSNRLPAIAAGLVALWSCIILLSWQLNLPVLKALSGGLVPVKANAAICFLLLSISSFFLSGKSPSRFCLFTGRACACLVLLIATLTLVEYAFGLNINIDQLLVKDVTPVANAPYRGRMAIGAAISLILLALALIGLDWRMRKFFLAEVVSVPVLAISFTGLLGYLYGTAAFRTMGPFNAMALPTAILLMVMGIGVICARPNRGLAALLTGRTAGAAIIRRLLPVVLFLPTALGWLKLIGNKAGYFDDALGVSLLVMLTTLILAAAIVWSACNINHKEKALIIARELAEKEEARAEQAKELLLLANKELDAFAYSVSHDLQSPLRAMSGFSQAVLEDYGPKLDAQGERYLKLIQKNAAEMGELIAALLSFSRLTRTVMSKSDVDMNALAQAVFHELKDQTPERNIQFAVSPLPHAEGDPTMLRQVFANLLANALKFTRSRETAIIEIGFKADADKGAYYVKDNGVGFDMQYADKLFGVFQRLHTVNEFEGTGIGLAIVARIISRHGGRVWAESAVDQGATFFFALGRIST